MPNIVNGLGQVKVGVKPTPPPPPSTLMFSIYSAYNADSQGLTSLKTSLFAAYNGESNANDSFGSNNGTAQGGLTYTTGKIGNAFNFNGTNAYVSLPNNSLNFTGDFSYSAWVKTNTSGNYVLLGNYTYSGGLNYGYAISLRGNDLYFQITNGATIVNLIYTNSSGWSSQYNHITIVRKNGVASEIYVNGTMVASNSSSVNPLYTSTHYPNIGVAQDPAFYWYFNGQVDAVNIWQKSLTQSEITELYNSGNGAQYITDNFYKPTTNDALNTYNGTAQGGLTYGVGKVGTAFQFNGTNAYVSLPDNSFNFTGDFSVSAWINVSNVSGEKFIISNVNGNGTNLNFGWVFGLLNNQLSFGSYGNTVFSSWNTSSTLLANTWYHVLVTKKPSESPKLYINGVLSTSTLHPNSSGTNSTNPVYSSVTYPNIKSTIGTYIYNNGTSLYGYWNGKIDALNVYQKELTQSEITELYNSGNGKQYPF